MTPSSKAKELAEQVKNLISKYRNAFHPGPDESNRAFSEELESILNDALAESFARGQEKKASCVCSVNGYCGLHEPIIEKARSDERAVCAEIADEHNGCVIKDCWGGKCGGEIANTIRRRGKGAE